MLSDRELQVLALLANGNTSAETAAGLGISKRTIEDHVRHACAKLGALNRVQAVALASKAGLIDPQPAASGRYCNASMNHGDVLRGPNASR
jgi:DNA-binding CsgD family transcriptional regulator